MQKTYPSIVFKHFPAHGPNIFVDNPKDLYPTNTYDISNSIPGIKFGFGIFCELFSFLKKSFETSSNQSPSQINWPQYKGNCYYSQSPLITLQ